LLVAKFGIENSHAAMQATGIAGNFGRMQNASKVGRVVGLFRYPVKSMAAESLDTIDVDWNGFAGDRRWAFVRGGHERSGFPWLTIREHSIMWHYKPRFVEPDNPDKSVTLVRTPGGKEFDVVDPALAAELGHGARVIKQGRGIFDTMPLSLITTQTIAALSSSVGLELEARRFRPNLLIEAAEDGDAQENSWIGRVLSIGDMQMRVDKRDKRCVMVNVDPVTTTLDTSVLRTIAQERQSCLGVYGTIVQPGRVAIGDQVTLN
jgi:uncharacterized protein YcbX